MSVGAGPRGVITLLSELLRRYLDGIGCLQHEKYELCPFTLVCIKIANHICLHAVKKGTAERQRYRIKIMMNNSNKNSKYGISDMILIYDYVHHGFEFDSLQLFMHTFLDSSYHFTPCSPTCLPFLGIKIT